MPKEVPKIGKKGQYHRIKKESRHALRERVGHHTTEPDSQAPTRTYIARPGPATADTHATNASRPHQDMQKKRKKTGSRLAERQHTDKNKRREPQQQIIKHKLKKKIEIKDIFANVCCTQGIGVLNFSSKLRLRTPGLLKLDSRLRFQKKLFLKKLKMSKKFNTNFVL